MECQIVQLFLWIWPNTLAKPLTFLQLLLGKTVTGSVHSKFLSFGKNRKVPGLELFQHLQKFSRSTGCTEFPYIVLLENEKEVTVFTAKDITTFILWFTIWSGWNGSWLWDMGYSTYPVCINIALLPCPLGFILHNSQHRCVCHMQQEELDIACNISDQTFQRICG